MGNCISKPTVDDQPARLELPSSSPHGTRAELSVASPYSSKGPNREQRQTGAGECDHDRARVLSLTMTRAL